MAAHQGVPAAAFALFRVTEGARTVAPTGGASAKTLELAPTGTRFFPALPPERPRGAPPWLVPAVAGCRGARLLAPSATLEVALTD